MRKIFIALAAIAALTFGVISPAQAAPANGVNLVVETVGTTEGTTASFTAVNDSSSAAEVFLRYTDENGFTWQINPGIVLQPGESYTFVEGVEIVPGNNVTVEGSLYQTRKNGSYSRVDREVVPGSR